MRRRRDVRALARYHAEQCAEYARTRRVQPLTPREAQWSLDFSLVPEQFEMEIGEPRGRQIEQGRRTRAQLVAHLLDVDETDAYELAEVLEVNYPRLKTVGLSLALHQTGA